MTRLWRPQGLVALARHSSRSAAMLSTPMSRQRTYSPGLSTSRLKCWLQALKTWIAGLTAEHVRTGLERSTSFLAL